MAPVNGAREARPTRSAAPLSSAAPSTSPSTSKKKPILETNTHAAIGLGLERTAGSAANRGRTVGADIAIDGGISLSKESITVDGETIKLHALPGAQSSTALLRAARAACDAELNPFLSASREARQAIADRLETYLGADKTSKRASARGIELRAASSALLARLIPAMKSGGEKAALRDSIGKLFRATEGERDPKLRRAMIANLTSIPDRMLLAKERSARDRLLGEVLHEAAPRDAWFGDDPKPVLNVAVTVMDEFWRGEIAAYKQNGYQVESPDAHSAIAVKKVTDDRGREVTIRVALRQGDTEVFDPVGDKNMHVVLYTGHAQLGGVAKIALDHAPRSDNGSKLIGFFACRGKQNLAAITGRFDESQVLVSDKGTYAHDDRIVIHHLLDGIAKGDSYAAIQRRALREGLWEKDNYFFPHEVAHYRMDDITGAGKLHGDALIAPIVYEPKLARVRGEATTMQPSRNPPEPGGLEGENVINAVGFANTVFGYFAEEIGNRAEKRLEDRLVPDGWFKSADKDEIVRLEDAQGADGKPVLKIKVNSAYANQSVDALAMMAIYDLGVKLGRRTRPDAEPNEHRMRALAMTGSYVYYMIEYSDVADDLLAKFAKRFNFPPSLAWPAIQRAIDSDPHADLSPKVLRTLERGMLYPFLEVNPNRTDPEFRRYIGRALDRLKNSGTEIGRATFEAITSGRVKVDELADLTLEDFKRAHREFAKDGVELPMRDALNLHDGRVSSIRKLNSSIDGYEWDDRIYLARGLTDQRLDETLVHEVNHVLNESEEHYRSPKAIFVEEYRAAYAEALYREERLDAKACKKLKERIIELYALEGVTPDDVTDRPPGIFLPNER